MYLTDKARRSPVPSEAYYSDHHAERERRELFLKSWMLVGFAQRLSNVGDYITASIVGLPIIVWRTPGGLRAFVNICTHRHSTVVLDECGNRETLRCPYHGWRYGADGEVCEIPEAWAFAPYNRIGTHRLPRLDVGTCGGLLFVRLSGAAPKSLRTFLGDAQFEMLETVFPARAVVHHTRRRTLACNWKLAVENAMEDLHTPFLHPDTFGPSYRERRVDEFWTRELEDDAAGVIGGVGPFSFAPNPAGLWDGHNVLDIFPGMHFTWGVGAVASTDSWYPLGPESTARTTHLIVSPDFWTRLRPRRAESLRQDVAAFAERVAEEDESLIRGIQKNLHNVSSRALIGVREERLHCFHDYLMSSYERD